MTYPRLRFAVLAGLLVAPSLGGCVSDVPDEGTSDDEFRNVSTPPDWDRPITRPASESAAFSGRGRCEFKRGSLAGETISPTSPLGDEIPIKTIVVLMMENRSFDSYFGKLGEFMGRGDVDTPPAGAAVPENPDEKGSPMVPWQHAPALCNADTPHEWSDMHRDYNNGRMNGFFAASHNHTEGTYDSSAFVSGARAMWYYDQRDIPFYYAVASTFATGDRYFSPLIGPTYPNRDFLYAASSYGEVGNETLDVHDKPFPKQDVVIFDELEKRHVSWRVYKDGVAAGLESTLNPKDYYLRHGLLSHHTHFRDMGAFFEDARKGTLPKVVFVDPKLLGGTPAKFHFAYQSENDEHPPSNIQQGQEFSARLVHALTKSPQWKELALFITWDEAGGIYDHVVPPPACPPDAIEPSLKSEEDRRYPGHFDRYGFRVPILVVSPYAKKSHVSHVVYDHTSILRFIEAKHRIPALSNRDANADPMFDMFDFANPPFMTPPRLPESYIDPAKYEECKRLFPHQK